MQLSFEEYLEQQGLNIAPSGQGTEDENGPIDVGGGVFSGPTMSPYTGDWKDSVGRADVPYTGDWKDVVGNRTGMPQWGSGDPFSPYLVNDAPTELFDMSPAALLALQAEMVAAGLIGKVTGRPDDTTIAAMTELMGHANARGATWQTTLADMRNAYANATLINEGIAGPERTMPPGSLMGVATFTADPYVPPDYDTLTTSIEELFGQHLGREPFDYEMTILVDKLKNLYRGDYDQQYAAAKQKFEDENFIAGQAHVSDVLRLRDATESMDPDAALSVPDPLVNPPGEAPTDVDVGASLLAFFKEKWGPQMDRLQTLQERQSNDEITMSALLGLNQLMSGPVQEL